MLLIGHFVEGKKELNDLILKYANQSMLDIFESEWGIYTEDENMKIDALLRLLPAHMVYNDVKRCECLLSDFECMINSPLIRLNLDPVYQCIMYNLLKSWKDCSKDLIKEGYEPNKVPLEIETLLKKDMTVLREEKELVCDWFRDIDFRLFSDFEDWDFDTEFLEQVVSVYLQKPELIHLYRIDIDNYLELVPNDLRQQYLKKKESIKAKPNLYKSVTNFKAFVEGNVYKAFHISEKPQEETGRSLVQTYLRPRGFREAEMGGGYSDLVYPQEETIIETKIWRDKERYLDGIVELSSYLDSQGYSTGYYILFDNTQSQNIIVKEQGSEIYDICCEGYTIHCFFVKINPVAPSKKRRGK